MNDPSVLGALRERVSRDQFDPTRSLEEKDVRELVEAATHAPSSYNLQHWRFLALTRPEDKARLKGVAYNQQKVEDASVAIVVLGDLRAHELLSEALAPEVASGAMPKAVADAWVSQAARSYGSDPARAREEAVRSGSLAAMALMLAAHARGLASAPMIGFDPVQLRREFQIPERYVPVMLVVLGYPSEKPQKQRARFPVDRVLSFGRLRDAT